MVSCLLLFRRCTVHSVIVISDQFSVLLRFYKLVILSLHALIVGLQSDRDYLLNRDNLQGSCHQLFFCCHGITLDDKLI